MTPAPASRRRQLLDAAEQSVLAGLLLGTATAALFVARNGFAPIQSPLSFALVFWKWFALSGLAIGLTAGALGVALALVLRRPGLARAVWAALVLAYLAILFLQNTRALRALVHQEGPARYRLLLPVAWALCVIGLAAVALSERRRWARAAAGLGLLAAGSAFYPEARLTTKVAIARPDHGLTGQRVLVIGLDGASWEVMRPLLDKGDLPHLAALRARGSWGPLASIRPTISPMIWTTIATGRPASVHGVTGFTEPRLRGVAQRLPELRPLRGLWFGRLQELLARRKQIYDAPITAAARRVPAFWNIASSFGSPVAVVNWWATWPAEAIFGRLVSEKAYYSILDGDPDADEVRLTWPDALFAGFAHLLVQPSQMDYATARRFLDLTPEEFERMRTAPPSGDTTIEAGLTYFYSYDESMRRVALHVMEQGRVQHGATPDTLVLFRLIDLSCHTSLGDSELVQPQGGPPDRDRYRRVVSEAYRTLDRAVGELAAAFGDGNLVILSDHGWGRESDRKWGHAKAPDGILLAAGPAFRPGRVAGATVFDVMPLLLRLKGFPLARDLTGHVPDVFRPEFLAAHPLATIESYGLREELEVAQGSGAVDQEMLDRLKALGYIQ